MFLSIVLLVRVSPDRNSVALAMWYKRAANSGECNEGWLQIIHLIAMRSNVSATNYRQLRAYPMEQILGVESEVDKLERVEARLVR
jgi:hypothetical protein